MNVQEKFTPLKLIDKYRTLAPKFQSNLIPNQPSFWKILLGKKQQLTVKCKCDKNQIGICNLVMKWIEEIYEWQTDKKFIRAYQHYNKKPLSYYEEIEICNEIEEKLSEQLQKIIKIQRMHELISNKTKQKMYRITLNYLKHVIYYKKYSILAEQNYIYLWLCFGISYHIDLNNQQNLILKEAIIFWSIEVIMEKLQNVSFKNIREVHAYNIIKLLGQYFNNQMKFLRINKVNIQELVLQWLMQIMCGYMGWDNLGFYFDCILRYGWSYIYKIFLSYFEKRIKQIQHHNISNREEIIQAFINSRQEWPMIFCNATTFNYDT